MAEGTVIFDVFRFDPEKDSDPRRQRYDVEFRPELSVLDGLRQIQEKRDSFLAFRASCNGGACGSCAMRINGRIRLACETRVAALRRNVIHVDPLPNLAVVKDLVVDMTPFWGKYTEIRPWLSPDIEYIEGEHAQSSRDRARIDDYIGCILCGACYSTCPAVRRMSSYLGPAALAKAYRFVSDSRDLDTDERLQALSRHAGVWGCDTTFRCVRVCPKDVPPTHGITAMRAGLVRRAARRIMNSLNPFRKRRVG